MDIKRRDFLRLAGGASLAVAAGGVLAACGGDKDKGSVATATTKAGGPPRKVKLGFIALTDCASIVMAHELGYFAERNLEVTLEKQASWPVTRDNLLNGQIDGAHALFGLPLAVASGVGGGVPSTALKIAMVLNTNGQAITLSKSLAGAGYADLANAKAVLEKKSPTLAMTFPGGTHDMWLRYWLRATGVDESKVKIIPIPPPQMVANMKVGTMDGYCVGEPWGAVAVNDGIGFTHIATQDIWKHHPEKALVVGEKFAAQTDVLKDVMGAILKAGKWLDNLANRAKAATVIGVPGYVNAAPAAIEGRLLGKYDIGAGIGTRTFTDDYMQFFNDGKVNFPRRGHAQWFLAQYQRLGLLKTAPNANHIVDSIIMSDLYAQVADAEKLTVPDDDMKPFVLKLDGATFDPKNPQEEVKRAA
ncbi:MAG TPA: CmpA/NrtA family ABC transporter substrate-binding protein [Acidimicrobiales bacterium]|nr:CmpA/NrtA family ABC transporter substrate-binding protein [Acidimicrobiales bacterium]